MAYVRDDTLVVPLTGVNGGHPIFLPANVQPGVVPPRYNFADVPFIPVRPHAQKEGVVSKQVTPAKPNEAPLSAFFRGGNLDAQF